MELRHLRYFVTLADEGGFVLAAQRLRVAQPALSRQMRDLERDLGVELIDRGQRPMRLAPGGEALLREARAILGEVSQAIDRARHASRGLAGRCTVSAGKLPTWSGMTAGLLAAGQRDFPMVDLAVSERVTQMQWAELSEGKSDLGIGIAPTREFGDLESQRIATIPFDAAVLPATHPLASRPGIRLAELAGEPIIAGFRADSDHHRMCVTIARRSDPHATIRLGESIADVFAAIATGIGWTPFPRALASWSAPGTVVVPVEDLRVTLPQYLIWKRGALSGVVRTVRDTLRAVAHETARTFSVDAPVATAATVTAAPQPVDPATAAAVPAAVELRHLRYFLAVAEEPSIGRAAARLSITQPTLSRQMRDLERIVGVKLVERLRRGSVVTAAGAEFAAGARRILGRVDGIAPEVHRAVRGATGRCLVATVPPTVVRSLLSSLLHRVATELSEVQVGFVEIPPSEQPEAIASGRIDIGICDSFSSVTPYLDRLRSDRLLDDGLCCALLAPDNPLVGRGEIALSELGDLPFLFVPRALYPEFYDRVMTRFAALDFRPRIDRTYDGLETTWSLVQRGEGWCVGVEQTLRHPPAGLAAVRIRDLHIPWGIDMLHRRDESRAVVLDVMALVRSIAGVEFGRRPKAEAHLPPPQHPQPR